ncbi:MAG: winged helix-turn-helix transcriptional regulator, partial [Candidatus Bathyarchaeia archaeon]
MVLNAVIIIDVELSRLKEGSGEMNDVKLEILKILWQFNRPSHLKEISKGVNLGARSVNMHLLNLKKKGYIVALGGGLYALTDLGKEFLGFPRINGNLARKILSKVPLEFAFHFYVGEDKPLNVYSDSL